MSGPLQADRVKQTSVTTGSGTLNLDATIPTGARSFVSGIGTGNTVYYCIEHTTSNEWEVGIGTVTSGTPDTLSRTTVISSSNSNAAVTFTTGTKNVFCVAPADYGIPLIKLPTTHALRIMNETALSSTVGNARGTGAVDLQSKRNNAAKCATGAYATITGGRHNTGSGAYSSIGGGQYNTASGTSSTVAGGNTNAANGTNSFIGGGVSNTVNTVNSAVCGGRLNAAAQNYCFVGGGYNNTAGGSLYSTVCGGNGNGTGALSAFCGGGEGNWAGALQSTVGGGKLNGISGQYGAILGGLRAVVDKYGQQAHSAGRFTNNGDAQRSDYILRKSTTTATQATMALDGGTGALTLSNDTSWAFDILIVARRTDADNESAGYNITGVIDRQTNAASTALVGTPIVTVLAEDNAGWDATVNADTTNGALRILVTGEASKTIQWVAHVRTIETTG